FGNANDFLAEVFKNSQAFFQRVSFTPDHNREKTLGNSDGGRAGCMKRCPQKMDISLGAFLFELTREIRIGAAQIDKDALWFNPCEKSVVSKLRRFHLDGRWQNNGRNVSASLPRRMCSYCSELCEVVHRHGIEIVNLQAVSFVEQPFGDWFARVSKTDDSYFHGYAFCSRVQGFKRPPPHLELLNS